MLENYEKELSQKRLERRIFWFVVWLFAIFLYLFFQGYYPYIRLDISGYFTSNSGTTDTGERPQIVRAFGIINIRTLPVADTITVNGNYFANGDKIIYDYGDYDIKIEKNGYIGLHTRVTLDKKNPFLIEALELLKKPVATKYAFDIKQVFPLSNGKLLAEVSASGSMSHSGTLSHTGLTNNINLKYYKVFDPETLETARSFSSALSPIGQGYFISETGAISAYDETLFRLTTLKNKAGTGTLACSGATLVGEELYCPNTKSFLTGNSDFTSKIISVKDSIIATSEGLFNNKMERLRKASSENSGSLAKIDDIITIGGNDYFLSSWELYADVPDWSNPSNRELRFDALPMNSIGKAIRFGGDTILLGYMKDGKSGMLLIDERGNKYPVPLEGEQISNIKIETLGSGYLISSKSKVYFYQKGANTPDLLLEWELLLVDNKRILFKKEWATYEMLLVTGRE